MGVRKATLSVKYKGESLNQKLTGCVTSFSYTDPASGEADSISLGLQNADRKWMGAWMPSKGDNISISITTENWKKAKDKKTFNCGSFTIDKLNFSGRPLSASIGAVSTPTNTKFKTAKLSKTWQDVTLKEIASKIAQDAGLNLYYEAGSINIKEIEQTEETNSSFLYGLCEKYGLAMKVYNSKLIIFDIAKYEAKQKVATIDESDMLTWSYETNIDGTYTGAQIKYDDPYSEDDEEITLTVGSGPRWYYINAKADSKYDAELQVTAKLAEANRKITTMEVKIMANTAIVASSVVEITGLDKLNGKYYVDKVKHNISSGYTMTLSLHLIQTKSKTASAAAADAANKASLYVVKAGDSLWMIAKQFYGQGSLQKKIYEANKSVIEAAAKARGMDSSDNGHWIFPGMKLVIPDVGTGKEVTISDNEKYRKVYLDE